MKHRKLAMEELNRLSVDEYKAADKTPLAIVLDDVRSLMNIGSVFRTADAFRLEKVYLCGITARPPHRDIQKTALGATDSVDWEHHESIADLLTALKADGWQLAAVEQTEQAITLQDFKQNTTGKTALIFGNEVKGVNNDALELCDQVIEIPQFGHKHSLNISVSVGIVVWEVFKQLQLK